MGQEPPGAVLRQDRRRRQRPGFRGRLQSRGIAYFRTINDNLKLVAELNRYRIDGRDGAALDEDTDTVALGAVLNW